MPYSEARSVEPGVDGIHLPVERLGRPSRTETRREQHRRPRRGAHEVAG